MSVVTSVVLQHAIEASDAADTPQMVEINAWLSEHGFRPLKYLSDSFAGTKHPQVEVWGGGYNHFPNRAFADFVFSRKWDDYQGRLVLMMTPEEGPTDIVRSAGWMEGER